MRCECGKCQESRRDEMQDDDALLSAARERIDQLERALRPFSRAYEHAQREGNLGGAYDRIGLEDLERAAEVCDGGS